jgi:RNA polymerase sigma factor (sigma-70 family)
MPETTTSTRRAPQVRPQGAGTGSGAPPAMFEDVYLRLAPLLRKIAIRRFNVPPADADTLVHDVFATFIASAEDVNAIEPYLIGAICNASRHYHRRTSAANALFCGDTPCAATPTNAIVDEVERKIILSRMLAQVGGRCRDLFQRYYLTGESTKTIADALQFKPATVLTFLHQCRKRALSAYRAMSERCDVESYSYSRRRSNPVCV